MPRPPKDVVISRKQIGDRVRALRQERGMTQAEVADALGAHFTNISEIERGVRGLTVQQVIKLCRTLRVSPNDILGTTKPPKEEGDANSRLLRRLKRIQKLPRAQQRAILKILDGLLESQSRANGRH